MRNLCHFARRAVAAAAVGCVLSIQAADAPTPTPRATRPNVVLIVLDDVGYSDLGSFGGEIRTPVMDQLARDGVRFTNFHTAAACSPTRAMLYTGVDSHVAGVGTLENVIADNQQGQPGYEGYLNNRVVSIGSLLSQAGYRTYFSGKWNLGETVEHAPITQGFQKSVALAQTGSDNYRSKPYAPIQDVSRWFEGDKELTLPKDFYSTRYYVDRLMGFIDADKASDKPFFSVLALQANHYPHQAPKPYIDRYMGRYDAGWDAIRNERFARQKSLGVVPADAAAPRTPFKTTAWDSLGAKDQREYSKRMAVYAGMLDAADEHIGRLRDYLKRSGQLDNTVFILLSDNGADPYRLDKVFWFWYPFNYSVDYETLGEEGSFSAYGQDWARVSNTPGYLFKGYASEGGVRTPLIVSWPARIPGGRISNSFTHVKDIVPTVLDLAGVDRPGDSWQGRPIARPDGTSMLAHLEGQAPVVHPAGQAVGYEMAGGMALYKDELKLVRDLAPFGDEQWHLYDLRRDPTEAHDLRDAQPQAFAAMQADMQAYLKANQVIPLPPGYNGIRQLMKNNAGLLLRMLWPYLAVMMLLLAGVLWGAWRLWRHLRHPAPRFS